MTKGLKYLGIRFLQQLTDRSNYFTDFMQISCLNKSILMCVSVCAARFLLNISKYLFKAFLVTRLSDCIF